MPGNENPVPTINQNSNFATHAKSFVIDSHKCMVGTPNFDPRSIRRMNSELAVFVEDNDFCHHLELMILERAKNSDLMHADGSLDPDVETNRIETLQQGLVMLLLPVIRIFERWF
jgi:phosphatidylserine/phosphatidylglycerophosphate/cardiolipin synthase-like enzyme